MSLPNWVTADKQALYGEALGYVLKLRPNDRAIATSLLATEELCRGFISSARPSPGPEAGKY